MSELASNKFFLSGPERGRKTAKAATPTVSRAGRFLKAGTLLRATGVWGLLTFGAATAFAGGWPVVFSEMSGVFTNEFPLELRAKSKTAVVRYTLDGTEPGPASAQYTGPLRISNIVQVRARAFEPNGAGSETVSQSFFLLEPDLWEFQSNLPLAILDTFGGEIALEEKIPGVLHLIGGDVRNSLRSPGGATERILINQRGRASTGYPKRSFTLKAIDEADDFRNISVLGMPKDSDWVLYAPYSDKALMRDVLSYELSNQAGRWAPRTRFVEVFVRERPGRLGREDYAGVYVLEERVKRDANRVDITKLDEGENAEPAVTGGYIFKKDHSRRNLGPMNSPGYPPFEASSSSSKTGYPTGPGGFPADPAGFQPPYRGRSSSSGSSSRSSSSRPSSRTGIVTNVIGAPMSVKHEPSSSRSVMVDEDGTEIILADDDDPSIGTSFKTVVLTNRFYFVDPEPDEITGVQRAWLEAHLNQAERAISGPDFKDPEKGYAAFIDVDSFIDYHLLVEVTKNVDGFRFSTFYHKERGGKIKMGPLWDWNLSFGNCRGKQGYLAENWLWPQLDDREYSWFRRLFENPDFGQRYVDRWTELRRSVFATTNVLARVDQLAALLDEAQKRNYERWPILSLTIDPNWFLAETYSGEVGWMKEWIGKRLAWIEAQFVPVPAARPDDGGRVSLEAAGAEILFTLDGSDPRAPGGAPAGKAARFTAPIAVKSNDALFARARIASRWSGPLVLRPPALTRR